MISQLTSRSELLLGPEAMERLRTAKVIVFGVGGVGSWCVESLVRSGLRHITIVDSDSVSPSNVNRQLMATTLTVGRPKVEVFAEHLLTVNPEAEVVPVQATFCADTAADFRLEDFDYIIDAIDSLKDKALLIEMATALRSRFFSSMGAALKLDPTQVKVAEFRNVKGCALARALRQRFKRSGGGPRRKFKCVYSEEHNENRGIAAADDPDIVRKARINGSMMPVTATFGLTLASLVINDMIKK